MRKSDDVALVVEKKCLNTVYELTQVYLSIVSNWAAENGYSINHRNTAQVLFTRK